MAMNDAVKPDVSDEPDIFDLLAYELWSLHPKELDHISESDFPAKYKGGARAWHYARRMRETFAALAAQGQEPVAVKALEWVDVGESPRCITVCGTYAIHPSAGPNGSPKLTLTGMPGDSFGKFDTVETAKAAAQSDYETRIRSALTAPAQPATDDIADAVLSWMVKHDLLDAGNEYRASDVLAVLDDLEPTQPVGVPLAEAQEIVIEAIRRMRAAHVGCLDLTMRAEEFLRTTRIADITAPAQPVGVPVGYVSTGELHTLQQADTCVDLFSTPPEDGFQFVPVYAAPQPPAEGGWTFRKGDRVRKKKGASWQGRIVGFYSTDLTPIGYAVESEREPGSVQIYPESALEPAPANGGTNV